MKTLIACALAGRTAAALAAQTRRPVTLKSWAWAAFRRTPSETDLGGLAARFKLLVGR
jgi:hypothetical protein